MPTPPADDPLTSPTPPPPVGLSATPSRDTPAGATRAEGNVGKTIDGRYVVERVIGEGGMGIVYAGRHRVIDKRVAIKVLRVEMAGDQDLNERFLQEARAASAIGNPHIVDISDFGQMADGATYFVMELLEGKSLSAILTESQGPVPVARLCHIAKQMTQGLAAAHAANIIHRDLKPDNVMLIRRGVERDFVKILDFGIAKVGGASKVTRAGSVFGTPHYMSPEQAAGTPVDHRTDIYALGVILYELASGKVPFDADNFMGILTQHMYKAPVPIRALLPEVDVPPGLDAIVLKCLTKKPEGRYATMDELLGDLEKLERGLLPDAVHEMMVRSGGFNVPADYFQPVMPAPVPASPVERSPRWPLYAVIGAVATGLCAVLAIGLTRMSNSTAQTITAQRIDPPAPAPLPPVASPPSVATLMPAPAAPEPIVHEVLVSVVPADAQIRQDGKELGQPPVALHLADGQHVVLALERKGYKPKTVTVDATEPKQLFSLEPLLQPVAPKPAGAKPVPAGIDDVGDPFTTRGAH